MPADTTTPLLGLLLQGTGNNNNAWGTNLNNSVITPIENAIAGVSQVSGLTGGSHALTAAETLSAIIVLSGTLTADQTIVVPNTTKKWSINNSCTGAFFVLVKTAAGTAINIPAGTTKDVICFGSNQVLRRDQETVGEFFYHAGANAPAGSLECNGATPLRASAVDLFAAIGTTWGAGNGTTTFTIPDGFTLGKFLRSRTGAVTVGTAQTNQNKSHTHTGSGTTSGVSAFHTHSVSGTTGAMSANASHTHAFNGTGGTIAGTGSTTVSTAGGATIPLGASASLLVPTNTDHTHTFSATTGTDSVDHTHAFSFTSSTGSADGTEARPESLVGILCIRY